ncbi:hypothetical protein CC80DRAFT_550702 [Byssothecium circinans]|uniref:Uncharacterized protein n=1 Tax=Byssothecium circinans TaxID=147558 RepID=A0A6A5TRE4_9PLEO|nr:hypothetical protein CC80DRAFT_550702 [Byssothecium circinans]
MDVSDIPCGHPHAHPPPNFVHDYLQLDRVRIDVSLRDDADYAKPADVYGPKVHRSSFTTAHPVNHLEVVSQWKGLSSAQASEIIIWERYHREALSKQVSESTRNMLLRELAPSPDSSSFIKRLVTVVSSITYPICISIDLECLLHDMLSFFYADFAPRHTDKEGLPSTAWFAAGGNLPTMVFNFLRTKDCYLHAAQSFVETKVRHTLGAGSDIRIKCEIDWQLPPIHFADLPVALDPGEEYCINPKYIQPNFSAFGFGLLQEDVAFHVDSETLPVKWDFTSRCFKATVPNFGTRRDLLINCDQLKGGGVSAHKIPHNIYGASSKPHYVETICTGQMTILFPDNVRFERTTRYNLKLSINEAKLPGTIPGAIFALNPQSVVEPNRMPQEFFDLPPSALHPALECDGSTSDDTVMAWAHSDRSSSGSECGQGKSKRAISPTCLPSVATSQRARYHKRKVSGQAPLLSMFDKTTVPGFSCLALDQFEHKDLEIDGIASKRLKLARHDSGAQLPLRDFVLDEGGDKDDESWAERELDTLDERTTLSRGEANASRHACNPSIWTTKLQEAPEWEGRNSDLKTRTRAYSVGKEGLKVMLSLKKKGSVKRMVFQRVKGDGCRKRKDSLISLTKPDDTTTDSFSDSDNCSLQSPGERHEATVPTHETELMEQMVTATEKEQESTAALGIPITEVAIQEAKRKNVQHHVHGSREEHDEDDDHKEDNAGEDHENQWSPLSQREIQRNFAEFQQLARTSNRVASADRKAFEQIFLADSSAGESEGWASESCDDASDLSIVMEAGLIAG